MPTTSDASRFATRPTPGWWDDRVRAEIAYAIFRYRAGHDPDMVWPHLAKTLTSLAKRREQKAAA